MAILPLRVALEKGHDERPAEKPRPCPGVPTCPEESKPGQGLESLVVLVVVDDDWRLERLHGGAAGYLLDDAVLHELGRQRLVVGRRDAADLNRAGLQWSFSGNSYKLRFQNSESWPFSFSGLDFSSIA